MIRFAMPLANPVSKTKYSSVFMVSGSLNYSSKSLAMYLKGLAGRPV